jgi:hypothetical protein
LDTFGSSHNHPEDGHPRIKDDVVECPFQENCTNPADNFIAIIYTKNKHSNLLLKT